MEISKKMALLAAGVLLVAFGWFYFAGRGDVSDIGKRADDTRAELTSAGEEQREQAAALDRAEGAADRSQSAIRNSQSTAGRIEEIERSDSEIIRECKSVLTSVRERGKAEN